MSESNFKQGNTFNIRISIPWWKEGRLLNEVKFCWILVGQTFGPLRHVGVPTATSVEELFGLAFHFTSRLCVFGEKVQFYSFLAISPWYLQVFSLQKRILNLQRSLLQSSPDLYWNQAIDKLLFCRNENASHGSQRWDGFRSVPDFCSQWGGGIQIKGDFNFSVVEGELQDPQVV